jgi:hypothetical protein
MKKYGKLSRKMTAATFDGLVKSRHSRRGGNPESANLLKRLDSRFHGNDRRSHFQTFWETISFGIHKKIIYKSIGKKLTFGCAYGKISFQTFVFSSNYFERGLL